MADIEKVLVTPTALSVVPKAAEMPLSGDGGDVVKHVNMVSGSGVSSGDGGGGGDSGQPTNAELGTSPIQGEKSCNSHPHDSEYDTASDLEGAEDYDDEDIDESITEDDDNDDDSDTDVDDSGAVGLDGLRLQDKNDLSLEAQKKVDEDRSNPQYIPKRGTFYEHDDRTAEAEGDALKTDNQQNPEIVPSGVLIISGANSGGPNAKSAPSPTISNASKPIKNWQSSSTVDRWTHDRFDAREQAPKSRAELVSAYGYDIRTEDAPPKARRRRRYGRGPNKYSRNWEDESAYLKANSNKERRPPKPSDFPALNDKSAKLGKSRRIRDDKEYQAERRSRDVKIEKSDKTPMGNQRINHMDEYRERSGDINNRLNSFKNQGGRQVRMEFKQKQRRPQDAIGNNVNNAMPVVTATISNISSRLEIAAQRDSGITGNNILMQQQQQSHNMAKQAQLITKQQPSQQQQQSNDIYNNNNNNNNNNNYNKKLPNHGYQSQQTLHQQQQQQQPLQQTVLNQLAPRQNIQIPPKTHPVTSNLSQRLQQVQNRNDPSHVGSVQMHALATQNQHQQQQQQQPPPPPPTSHPILGQQQQSSNIIMAAAPPQQQQAQQPSQLLSQQGPEQRVGPKRYSSLRRSQHEAQHMSEQQQQLQQMQHMQSQQQQQQQQSQMMMPDQHMIQANLMQLYHQENLQAQMQALQVSQGNATVKPPPNYPAVPQAAGPPQSQTAGGYSNTAPGASAYYVNATDAYAAATSNSQTPQAGMGAGPYPSQPPPNNYLTQSQAAAAAAATLSYPGGPTGAGNANQSATAPYGPPAGVGVVQQQQQPNTNAGPSANYQNYNTVGGTTYFVPPPAQQATRSVILPQRRPTNAIPILPPTDKSKPQTTTQQPRAGDTKEEDKNLTPGGVANNQNTAPPIDSAENIDHIIDNMFMQRPAFQPPTPVSTPSSGPSQTKTPSNESLPTTDNSTNASNSNSESNSQNSEKLSNNASGDNGSNTNNSIQSENSSSNNNGINGQE